MNIRQPIRSSAVASTPLRRAPVASSHSTSAQRLVPWSANESRKAARTLELSLRNPPSLPLLGLQTTYLTALDEYNKAEGLLSAAHTNRLERNACRQVWEKLFHLQRVADHAVRQLRPKCVAPRGHATERAICEAAAQTSRCAKTRMAVVDLEYLFRLPPSVRGLTADPCHPPMWPTAWRVADKDDPT